METPTLIYCAAGNKKFARIAIQYGFAYGAQMPATVYTDTLGVPLHFVDLHPERPPSQWVYISKLRRYSPEIASVHDWHSGRDYEEIMLRAEEIAQYVRTSIIIIPKVPGTISKIPKFIGGKSVVLGYSIPTRHGKTDLPYEDFAGWPVHLLGGSPQRQMEIYRKMRQYADVVSVDGNMHQKMAVKFCAFWDSAKTTRYGYWPTIEYCDDKKWGDGTNTADAPYEAFRRSCLNIERAWLAIK